MSPRAHAASFGHGLGLGLVLSVIGAAGLLVLSLFIATEAAVRLVVAALGLVYVLYLMGRSRERIGRVTTLTLWIAAAAVAWLMGLPFAAYVLVHVGLVWLVRSLYYYTGLLPALVDFGLAALGVIFGVWAAQRSGSAWLAFWCFFLVQAFHVLIPATVGERSERAAGCDDRFWCAHRAAESAVRRLSTTR
jgi:hypothetical protein